MLEYLLRLIQYIRKTYIKKYNNVTLTVYNFIFAGIGALLIVNPVEVTETLFKHNEAFIPALMLAVISTVLPYFIYTVGLKYTSASKAAIICCAEPVVASVLSVFVVKEPFSISQLAGIILIITSITLLQTE